MDKIKIVNLDDIMVAYVKSDSGPAGAKRAFDILENRMPSLKGRKMYGVIYSKRDEYFACVLLNDEHPQDMGFERMTIPGGRYAKNKIVNWTEKIDEVALAFQTLEQSCGENGFELDPTRPSIEYYRSSAELIIFQPIV